MLKSSAVEETIRTPGEGAVAPKRVRRWPTPRRVPRDRRIEFLNLPRECLIRIYTVAGDLVQIIPHSSTTFNDLGDANTNWVSDYSESWDLNSRNGQQVVSGLYVFSVEDLTPGNKGNIEVGKFVIIR